MEWPSKQSKLSGRDWDLFEYGIGSSTVVRRLSTEKNWSSWDIVTDAEWDKWMDNEAPRRGPGGPAGLCLIICGRVASPKYRDEAVNRLPFSRDVFGRITDQFRLHRTITRTINRNEAYFNCIEESDETSHEPSIGFTARMSSSWPDDLAISATFFPRQGLTLGVLYGCTPQQKRCVIARLRNSEYSFLHPLLTIGIFCEAERERLVEATDRIIDAFLYDFVRLAEGGREVQEFIATGSSGVPKSLDNFANCNHITKGLRDVQRQLKKIIALADGDPVLQPDTTPTSFWKGLFSQNDPRNNSFAVSGKRIKGRLEELMAEYQSKIEECESYMRESSHIMQTVSTQLNTTIALEATRDNSRMRLIAFLTMFYLPLTSVATIFSMGVFDWNSVDGHVISSYFWVFLVVAGGLTLLTFLTWFVLNSRRNKSTATSFHTKAV